MFDKKEEDLAPQVVPNFLRVPQEGGGFQEINFKWHPVKDENLLGILSPCCQILLELVWLDPEFQVLVVRCPRCSVKYARRGEKGAILKA